MGVSQEHCQTSYRAQDRTTKTCRAQSAHGATEVENPAVETSSPRFQIGTERGAGAALGASPLQLTRRNVLGRPGQYLQHRNTWCTCPLPAGSPPLLGTARPRTRSLQSKAGCGMQPQPGSGRRHPSNRCSCAPISAPAWQSVLLNQATILLHRKQRKRRNRALEGTAEVGPRASLRGTSDQHTQAGPAGCGPRPGTTAQGGRRSKQKSQ